MAKKATKSKPKPTKKRTPFKLSKQNKIILGSLLMLFSIALFFSFISFYFNWQDDQSLLSEFKDRNELAKNLLNKFGASISHFFMYKGFGVASLIIPFLICITGIYLFLGLPLKSMPPPLVALATILSDAYTLISAPLVTFAVTFLLRN